MSLIAAEELQDLLLVNHAKLYRNEIVVRIRLVSTANDAEWFVLSAAQAGNGEDWVLTMLHRATASKRITTVQLSLCELESQLAAKSQSLLRDASFRPCWLDHLCDWLESGLVHFRRVE